jgi:predicted small metal-binding protein
MPPPTHFNSPCSITFLHSDFSYFAMDTLIAVRYVGGFAIAGSVTPDAFFQARPDPHAGYAQDVVDHMNDHHGDSLIRMVQVSTGISECSEARMTGVDRLGFWVSC